MPKLLPPPDPARDHGLLRSRVARFRPHHRGEPDAASPLSHAASVATWFALLAMASAGPPCLAECVIEGQVALPKLTQAPPLPRYPNLTYIPQDLDTLNLLLWGESRRDAARLADVPIHSSHPLFQENRVRFYVEPWPWIDDLRAYDFAFGSRIHGNIAALLAGTPAFVLAHDSRTLELARYFEIPHRPIPAVAPDVDAADLYADADYGPLVAGHPERLARFTAYLERHGLAHVFAAGADGGSAFDARLAETSFPPAVDLANGVANPDSLAARARRARYGILQAGRSARIRRMRAAALRRMARLAGRADAASDDASPSEGG